MGGAARGGAGICNGSRGGFEILGLWEGVESMGFIQIFVDLGGGGNVWDLGSVLGAERAWTMEEGGKEGGRLEIFRLGEVPCLPRGRARLGLVPLPFSFGPSRRRGEGVNLRSFSPRVAVPKLVRSLLACFSLFPLPPGPLLC